MPVQFGNPLGRNLPWTRRGKVDEIEEVLAQDAEAYDGDMIWVFQHGSQISIGRPPVGVRCKSRPFDGRERTEPGHFNPSQSRRGNRAIKRDAAEAAAR